mmetsp:Transcript_31729/g.92738  ORF Transcript_31729/g.92738 Transcript_31729/m.92738 type:complete len:159 (+) Transcript_31729:136-612(+)
MELRVSPPGLRRLGVVALLGALGAVVAPGRVASAHVAGFAGLDADDAQQVGACAVALLQQGLRVRGEIVAKDQMPSVASWTSRVPASHDGASVADTQLSGKLISVAAVEASERELDSEVQREQQDRQRLDEVEAEMLAAIGRAPASKPTAAPSSPAPF